MITIMFTNTATAMATRIKELEAKCAALDAKTDDDVSLDAAMRELQEIDGEYQELLGEYARQAASSSELVDDYRHLAASLNAATAMLATTLEENRRIHSELSYLRTENEALYQDREQTVQELAEADKRRAARPGVILKKYVVRGKAAVELAKLYDAMRRPMYTVNMDEAAATLAFWAKAHTLGVPVDCGVVDQNGDTFVFTTDVLDTPSYVEVHYL